MQYFHVEGDLSCLLLLQVFFIKEESMLPALFDCVFLNLVTKHTRTYTALMEPSFPLQEKRVQNDEDDQSVTGLFAQLIGLVLDLFEQACVQAISGLAFMFYLCILYNKKWKVCTSIWLVYLVRYITDGGKIARRHVHMVNKLTLPQTLRYT